jgi:hypothetical protein
MEDVAADSRLSDLTRKFTHTMTLWSHVHDSTGVVGARAIIASVTMACSKEVPYAIPKLMEDISALLRPKDAGDPSQGVKMQDEA